jgi:hypothetical protein
VRGRRRDRCWHRIAGVVILQHGFPDCPTVTKPPYWNVTGRHPVFSTESIASGLVAFR